MNTNYETEQKQFISTWKQNCVQQFIAYTNQLLANRTTQPAELQLLRRLIGGGDPYKGFSPITNKIKLANGQSEWQTKTRATKMLAYRLKLIAAGKATAIAGFTLSADYAAYLLAQLGA